MQKPRDTRKVSLSGTKCILAPRRSKVPPSGTKCILAPRRSKVLPSGMKPRDTPVVTLDRTPSSQQKLYKEVVRLKGTEAGGILLMEWCKRQKARGLTAVIINQPKK
jgi:hypothetical protein